MGRGYDDSSPAPDAFPDRTPPIPEPADVTGRVVVVGSANADQVVAVVRRPCPGETVTGDDVVVQPGGKGANAAVAAARAGAEVGFCGCVGDDAAGELLAGSLSRAGVDVEALARVGRPTGQAMILLTPDGENSIVVSPGANAEATPAYAETCRDAWERAAVVVLNLEIPLDTVRLVALGAQGRVVLNAAPAARLDDDLLAVCDPLVVNATEARIVLGEDDDDFTDLARALVRLGARSVVITLGADGALVADGDGVTEVAPHQVADVVDTTGAGDCFTGALAAGLAPGDDLRTSASYAAVAAALSVRTAGAQTSYPERAEVLRISGPPGPETRLTVYVVLGVGGVEKRALGR